MGKKGLASTFLIFTLLPTGWEFSRRFFADLGNGPNKIEKHMKLLRPKLLIGSLLTICLAGFAGAASITVNNASFEDNAISNSSGSAWADGIPNGWNSQGDVAGTPDPAAMTIDGANNLYFLEETAAIGATGSDGPQHLGLRTGGFVYQDLGVAFQPNTTYTVDILANRRGGANVVGYFGITDSSVVGNAALPTFLGTEGGVNTTNFVTANEFLAVSSLTAAEGNVATFTTGASVPAGNVFVAVGATGGNVPFDLVSVDASAVPEPSSMALLSLVAFGLLRRRR